MRHSIFRIKSIFISSAIAFLAVGCSAAEEFRRQEQQPEIRFELGFSGQTRVSANAFEIGDVTGLYMTEYSAGSPTPLQISGNAVNNAALRFDGTSWTTSPTLYWDKGVKYDVYGYYPYSESKPSSIGEYRISVATDQTTPGTVESLGGYEASDFLWAKTKGVRYPNTVNLAFSHRMSRLVVNIVKGENFEGEIPKDMSVKVHGTVVDALADLGSGDVVKDPDGKTKVVKMRKESDTSFSAIIVPQRIDSRQPLVEVITSNVAYLLESRFVFRPGVQHSIDIVLDNDPEKVKIEIGGDIQGWN